MPMMKVAAAGEMPNQMIANGTQARPGIGRSTRTTQDKAVSSDLISPQATPSASPRPEPSTRPLA